MPDAGLFPAFDDNLRQAMREETERFIDSQLRDEPQRHGTADGQLHVRQRAARGALRDPERVRQSFPARHADRRAPVRPPGARQRADGDLLCEPHVARDSRACGCSKTSSARRRPRRRRTSPRCGRTTKGEADHGARPAGAAPPQPGVRDVPPRDGSRSGLRSRISTRSAGGAARTPSRRSPSTRRA